MTVDPLDMLKKQAQALKYQIEALLSSIESLEVQAPELPELDVPTEPKTFRAKERTDDGQ